MNADNPNVVWPLLIYAAAVVALIGVMLGLSYILGQRHHEKATGDIYEGGMIPTGNARLKFSVNFYLIAMFFVIFDLETIFLVAWAVSLKEAGWTGFIGVSVFIFVLFAVLLYEWRTGAFEIAPSGKKILRQMRKQRET